MFFRPRENTRDQEERKRQNISRKSSTESSQDSTAAGIIVMKENHDDEEEYSLDRNQVDDLWSTWDTILIEWNKGGKKKIPAVKVRIFVKLQGATV